MTTQARRKRVPWAAKEQSIMELAHDGHVDTSDLIRAARNPDHPCHGDFTWDDATAADERRHDQARALIRRCEFQVVYEEHETKAPVFVSHPTDRDFLSLGKIRGVRTTSAVLDEEIRRLHGVASRVYGIALAKVNIVGVETVEKLKNVHDLLATLIE